MNIKIEDKTIYINFTKDFFISSYNDWSQLFGKFNWYTFTLINIYFENDKWTGGINFEFIILGLGFRVRYNYKPEILEKIIAKTNKK